MRSLKASLRKTYVVEPLFFLERFHDGYLIAQRGNGCVRYWDATGRWRTPVQRLVAFESREEAQREKKKIEKRL